MDSRAEINWKIQASEPHTKITEERKRAAVLLSVNSGALFIAPFLPLTSFLINRMPLGLRRDFRRRKKASSKKHRKEKQSVRIVLRAQIAIEALHCSLICTCKVENHHHHQSLDIMWWFLVCFTLNSRLHGAPLAFHSALCRRCTWNNILIKVQCRRRSSLASSHFSFSFFAALHKISMHGVYPTKQRERRVLVYRWKKRAAHSPELVRRRQFFGCIRKDFGSFSSLLRFPPRLVCTFILTRDVRLVSECCSSASKEKNEIEILIKIARNLNLTGFFSRSLFFWDFINCSFYLIENVPASRQTAAAALGESLT